jgi:hypothetical protein
LWSRSDKTPFGYGRPYTLSQLEAQLKQHQFLPEHHRSALYQPPSERRFWLKAGAFCERMGAKMPIQVAGGVWMVEASKRVHAQTGTTAKVKRPVRVPNAVAEPAVGRMSRNLDGSNS